MSPVGKHSFAFITQDYREQPMHHPLLITKDGVLLYGNFAGSASRADQGARDFRPEALARSS